jgi:hypothetical protein
MDDSENEHDAGLVRIASYSSPSAGACAARQCPIWKPAFYGTILMWFILGSVQGHGRKLNITSTRTSTDRLDRLDQMYLVHDLSRYNG